jgi:CRP-like cAMP-binding protein
LPELEPVALDLRQTLIARDVPIDSVYFPLAGVVSLVSTLADGTIVEVVTIGNEGLVGSPLLLRATSIPFNAMVQVPGAALRMDAAVFARRVHMGTSPFGARMSRYTQALFTHIAQHVVCNQVHLIAQRCARWLLQTHDRMAQEDFVLTHEFLAQMLGVRRASVTEVVGRLQQAGLLRYRRGRMQILDRPGLEAASCACYSVIIREYDRLLGPA